MGNIDSLPEIELREEEGLLNIEQQLQLSPKCACVFCFIDVHLAHFKVLKTIGQGAFGKVIHV